jgi:hypothetical protein
MECGAMGKEEFVRLKRSKEIPVAGDVFAFRFVRKPDRYFFGRIIRDDVVMVGETYLLVYFYRTSAPSPTPPESLSPRDLAVAPVLTGDVFWTKARYFETVARRELSPEDKLPRHLFWDIMRYRYVTEDGAKTTEPMPGELADTYAIITDVGLEKLLMKPLIGIEHPLAKR